MSVFDDLRAGQMINIGNSQYQKEVHGEIDRCNDLCHEINATMPSNRERLVELENKLLHGQIHDGTFFTPPMFIDCGNQVHLGQNVYVNHNLTMMSLGTITIDDGVMMGPGVGLFTVNHDPANIRNVMTKEIHIKKNAWLGARVNVAPGVTIGENAIIGTGAVVTKDIPDNTVAVGVPAKVIKYNKVQQ
ncbi:sugar O-acetyltransferase [Lactiplantibacillus pentosus]|uniref:Acetyltransferase n=3 Tax=Lactiplantibacillus pentosus TaxID=1589 RepID=A0AAX6LED8_LACPE|nr:sugar O-acetyltransferase [Lactiplantibacillus pentosus]AYJ43035.1 sugar O-acetyltransferase [Lactiplantibacillus pentosus]KRK25308.1 galactoside o-acetyltransferase [Lactiplantibacillus pentosus DSM 20314]MBU7495794.1 sugar O-acetyltransferase [Lactiplantibacillus pentosus]MCT3295258.1 sugar O-acetyltransferase [Lactiplantibacillus pentosus]MCT3300785.1 sugar O-acetyltransferase [Lactiplantibacillus pentosus]